jgi:hypothetical protein
MLRALAGGTAQNVSSRTIAQPQDDEAGTARCVLWQATRSAITFVELWAELTIK